MNVKAKILLLGDGGVGKTAIRVRYLGRGFSGDYLVTMGADFALKEMQLSIEDKDYRFRFSIWDLAGQQHFASVRSLYYNGSHAAILVYDITNYDSFKNIERWVVELGKNNQNQDIVLILLGNKSDLRSELPEHELVTEEEGKLLATNLIQNNKQGTNNKIRYLETSALTGDNINQIFEHVAHSLVNIYSKYI